MQIVYSDEVTDGVVMDILGGEAALWLGDSNVEPENLPAEIGRTIAAPWRAVYVESPAKRLAQAFRESAAVIGNAATNGLMYLISSDPTATVFPAKFKPVFFLNGEEGASSANESTALSRNSGIRRRLNMLARLRDLEPRRVFLVAESPLRGISDLADLWQSDFRASITVVSPTTVAAEDVGAALNNSTALSSISWIRLSPIEFLRRVRTRVSDLALRSDALTRIKLPSDQIVEIDLSRANLPDHPLLDVCDLIQVRDLLPISPTDLTETDFKSFFTKSLNSWRPYAAGLPWIPDAAPERSLISALTEALNGSPDRNHLVAVTSEPGAGGTTQARALAYAAAKHGFPSLIVKSHCDVPSALQITNFLFRAVAAIKDSTDGNEMEPAWLIVLDAEHLDRCQDDLWRLYAELERSGRKFVLLKVTSSDAPLEPPQSIPFKELSYVNHDLDQESVADLGRHLNSYLRNFGREKTLPEWNSFWQSHRPDIDTSIASFWIALEFWLAGYLELGESIQSWVLGQFRELTCSVEIKMAILEIATLSIERRAFPERLLAPLVSPSLPWSQVLEEARRSKPGIGLVVANAVPYGRVWAVAHDVLARHLLNGVWADRVLCAELELGAPTDVVDLRLALLRRSTTRSSLGESFARPLAIALATTVLKIDERGGNPEFFRHWKTVLLLLDAVPLSVRNTSRTFNHHVAISRRRVMQSEIFQATDEERKSLLIKAEEGVLFALTRIAASPDDESDLNLYNSLALVYQDLATLERSTSGDKAKIVEYLLKSDDATRRALRENSTNSYVLETAAKNMLRRGFEMEASAQVEAAAEALSYVFQASMLETATARTISLGKLANEALTLLRTANAVSAISSLCGRGNPFGYIARAWLHIASGGGISVGTLEGRVPKRQAEEAIEILKESPSRQWLLVQMEYQLTTSAASSNFERQLQLLDELDSAGGFHLSLQQRLDRAVLLYQEGRHLQATKEFDKLRVEIRSSDAVLAVPERLRWLLTTDRARRAICSARVRDSSSGRPMAQVSELSRALAPFNAQEFGLSRMAPGQAFKAYVTFSAMGPFLKPIDGLQR